MTERVVRVHPGVRADLQEAVDYYREIDESLPARLIDSYVEALGLIKNHPLALAEYVPGYRRVVLRTFPYLLAFVIDDDGILVAALLHVRRDPETSRSTLAGR